MQLVPKKQLDPDDDDENYDDRSLELNAFSESSEESTLMDDCSSQLHDSKHSNSSGILGSSKHSQSSFGSSFSNLHNSSTRLINSMKQGVKSSIVLPSKLTMSGLNGLSGHVLPQKKYCELEDNSAILDKEFQDFCLKRHYNTTLNESGHTGTTSSESLDHSFGEEGCEHDDDEEPLLVHSQSKAKAKSNDQGFGTIWVNAEGKDCIQLNFSEEPSMTKPNAKSRPRQPELGPTSPRRTLAVTKRSNHPSRRNIPVRRTQSAPKPTPQKNADDSLLENNILNASLKSRSLRNEVDITHHISSPRRRVDPNVILGRIITPRMSSPRRGISNDNIDFGRITAPIIDKEIGRISPRFLASKRERVQFDFNPKDLKELSKLTSNSRKNTLADPKTPKITKPLVDNSRKVERATTAPLSKMGIFSIPGL